MRIIKSLLILLSVILFGSKINAQEITVFPGFWNSEYFQDDQRIDKKELEALLAKNEEVQAYWKKAKRQEIVGGVASVAELGFVIWMYSEIFDESRTKQDRAKRALGPLIGGVGTAVIAGILINASNKSKRKAILTFNKQFDTKTAYRLVPTSNQNGVGLALRF